MSIRTLKGCIKKHGKAKTAVALGLKETNAINNWIFRNAIPEGYMEKVKSLRSLIDVKAAYIFVEGKLL